MFKMCSVALETMSTGKLHVCSAVKRYQRPALLPANSIVSSIEEMILTLAGQSQQLSRMHN